MEGIHGHDSTFKPVRCHTIKAVRFVTTSLHHGFWTDPVGPVTPDEVRAFLPKKQFFSMVMKKPSKFMNIDLILLIFAGYGCLIYINLHA